MGYDKLERNLIDIIKEEQAKLGFFREDIRLYYPLSSLNHFFDAADTADEMQARLEVLPASITDKLGDIEVSHKGDRFCFHIPQEGTVITLPEMNLSRSLSIWSADMAVPWMKSWICSILILIMSLQKKWTTGNSTA